MTLVPLSRRDATLLPEHAYDVRGWEVRTERDDEKVGKVDDMLLDEDGSPRLLAVDMGMFKKHILLPLDRGWADREEQIVWVEGFDKDQLSEIPEYDRDGDVLSDEYENRLAEHYDRTAGRGTRSAPATGKAPGETSRGELARLSELGDFRVSKTSADPRGWTVVTGDGAKVGKVVELLVDRTSMNARYLDVRVDEKELGLEPLDRHVLLPASRVHLNGNKDQVVVDGLFAEDLGDYPVYRGLPLDDRAERDVVEAFARHGRPDPRGTAEPARHRFFRSERVGPGEEAAFGGDAGERSRRVRPGEEARVQTESGEVRIRVSGDDIIIEKNPRQGD